MAQKSLIHLAQFLVHGPSYHSLGMWRHPKTDHTNFRWDRPKLYEHIAQTCERGLFDMVFFADLNYISDSFSGTMEPALRYAAQAPEHDPMPLLAWLGAVTERIGLAATFSTSNQHPFYAARMWATLDHMTEGRAGWNVVTSINRNQAANYGNERAPTDKRYEQAHEFMEVCQKLWASWDEGAVVMDQEGAVFADASKVHRIEHEGAHFRSRGPLNVVPSPQNGPAIMQAGTSPKGQDFAANTQTPCSPFSLGPRTPRPTAIPSTHTWQSLGAIPPIAPFYSVPSPSSARAKPMRWNCRRNTTPLCRWTLARPSSPPT